MVIAIICPGRKTGVWQRKIQSLAPDTELRIWPELGNLAEIDVALCWNHPPGLLKEFPKLQLIASLGAGVEHILSDPELPVGVPVTRVVDDKLKQGMSQYLVWAVLDWIRQMPHYRADQQQARWQPRMKLPDYRVGIMGLGELGGDIARHLAALGIAVSGWARGAKSLSGVDCYAGPPEMPAFLAQSNVLINLLPLTDETRGILNHSLFARLPKGAYVINVGRGGHLAEADLLAALDNEQLGGACLDVMAQEPLPADHPFWSHPKITLTPHISSISSPDSVVRQILDNVERLQRGTPLQFLVDPERGY